MEKIIYNLKNLDVLRHLSYYLSECGYVKLDCFELPLPEPPIKQISDLKEREVKEKFLFVYGKENEFSFLLNLEGGDEIEKVDTGNSLLENKTPYIEAIWHFSYSKDNSSFPGDLKNLEAKIIQIKEELDKENKKGWRSIRDL